MASVVSLGSSATITSTCHMEPGTSVDTVSQHFPCLDTTLAPNTTQPPLYTLVSLSTVRFQATSTITTQYCAARTSLNATLTEFYPASISQQNMPSFANAIAVLFPSVTDLHAAVSMNNACASDHARSNLAKSGINEDQWGSVRVRRVCYGSIWRNHLN